MKYLKTLLVIFIFTLFLSSLGFSAKTMHFVGYIKNETVPGFNGDWQTRPFTINSEEIGWGYDYLYNTSVSRDVDVRVRHFSNGKNDNNGSWQRLTTLDKEKQLSFFRDSDSLFLTHIGDYTVQFSTDLLHFGNTTIHYADWYVDDRR